MPSVPAVDIWTIHVKTYLHDISRVAFSWSYLRAVAGSKITD
jgi:hypothetical protein